MADLRDFTGKNRKFTGTTGVTVSSGANTGNRVNEAGRLRFNTGNNLLEYYTGTEWKSIDAPPVINTVAIDGGTAAASGFLDNTQSGNATIVIAGALFDTSSATILLEATSGSNITPTTTTINNANQITITVPYSSFINANEPYAVKVTNPSGLTATLADAIYNDTVPTFTNAADTTYNIFDSSRGSVSIAAADLCGATDAEGDTLTYAVSSGALPSGLSINTSNGNITGSTSAVGTDTTSTFSVTVSQTGGGQSATRQFKIVQKAPVTETFNSSGTFTVATGLTSVDVLVVAGGGGTGARHAGGGGAGGLIYRPGFPISPGTPISVTVGNGGPATNYATGGDSVFSNLTAKGGGGGDNGNAGQPGGSGAGGAHSQKEGGNATQPGQPGDSGTYGFGNAGGNGYYSSPPTGAQGGGGGGAGGVGGNSGPNDGSNGGIGRAYSISGSSVYYAGGGAGGNHQNASDAGSGGQGGGGNRPPGGPGTNGQPGTANRGGGAGGGNDVNNSGSSGGSGIVIVQY